MHIHQENFVDGTSASSNDSSSAAASSLLSRLAATEPARASRAIEASADSSPTASAPAMTNEDSVKSNPTPPEVSARANAYAVLGALLVKPPTNELLQSVLPSATELSAASSAGADNVHNVLDGWRALAKACGTADAPKRTDAELDDEYHDLFIGIVRGEVMPYGSWYMSGFLMDKPLAVLRRDLRDLGFERAKGVSEPEDHAGALCETMAMIIGADDISDRAEKTFFERHMRPWMTLFFKDMENAKTAVFYKDVADFGQRFMAFEKEYFDIG